MIKQLLFQLAKNFKEKENYATKEHNDGYFINAMHHF